MYIHVLVKVHVINWLGNGNVIIYFLFVVAYTIQLKLHVSHKVRGMVHVILVLVVERLMKRSVLHLLQRGMRRVPLKLHQTILQLYQTLSVTIAITLPKQHVKMRHLTGMIDQMAGLHLLLMRNLNIVSMKMISLI